MSLSRYFGIAVLAAALLSVPAAAAPVSVFARPFVGQDPLKNHKVLLKETGAVFVTDSNGEFTADLPVGSNATFQFMGGQGYEPTSAGTVTVPAGGLTTVENRVVLQVPSDLIYDLFRLIIPGEKNLSLCQIVVTVCNIDRTVESFPQGLPGVHVEIEPPLDTKTYFFGTWGRLWNGTDPLPNNLTTTSWDGGVYFMNLPLNTERPYVVRAWKEGYVFSSSTLWCNEKGFVNAAPNQGPRAISGPSTDAEAAEIVAAESPRRRMTKNKNGHREVRPLA